jgi:hypothetical protein
VGGGGDGGERGPACDGEPEGVVVFAAEGGEEGVEEGGDGLAFCCALGLVCCYAGLGGLVACLEGSFCWGGGGGGGGGETGEGRGLQCVR